MGTRVKSLKWLGQQMNIFLVFKIKSVFHVHAQMVLRFLAFLFKDKNKYKVFAFFFEKLTNLQIVHKCSVLPFESLDDFLQCTFIAGFRIKNFRITGDF